MQRGNAAVDRAEHASPRVELAPDVALICARTEGVRLFARCPPVHTILIGACRLAFDGAVHTTTSIALPANAPHELVALRGPHACVAYLDPRRFRFADVERLAASWRRFVPGRDDLAEAVGDALRQPQRRVDARLLRALALLDEAELSVAQAARGVALSESRLTHLMTDTLGAPPRTWRAWLKLRRAIRERLLGAATLTQAAHRAGFADSAHLTRTCKQLAGVRPAQMLPRDVQLSLAEGGAGRAPHSP